MQPHAAGCFPDGLEPVTGQQRHGQGERAFDAQTPGTGALVFGAADAAAALGRHPQRRPPGRLPFPHVGAGRIVGEHGGHQDVGEQVVVARGDADADVGVDGLVDLGARPTLRMPATG